MAKPGQYEVQVDVTAKTDKLDRGMRHAADEVDAAATRMNGSVDSVGDSMDSTGLQSADLLGKISRLAAGLFLAEGAFKLATAAISDQEEAAEQMMRSLPVVGPLVSSFLDFNDALQANQLHAKRTRADIVELANAYKELASSVAQNTRLLDAEAEMLASSGHKAHEIAVAQYDERRDLVRRNLELQLEAIEEEYTARSVAIGDANLEYEEMVRQETENRNQKYEAIRLAKEEAAIAETTLLFKRDGLIAEHEAAKEKARLERLAERELELAAEAEEHHKQIVALHEEEVERQEELAKIEEERREKEKEAMEEAIKLAKTKHKLETEIAEARADAERAVAGATATFSTAGGSFTAGVSAQVNEAKLLNKISQQSRDYLAQIVQNTMQLGLGFA
jgi:hypothetical protein